MRSARLLLVGAAADAQLAALRILAERHGIRCETVTADGPEPTLLTVGTHRLEVNGEALSANDVVYTHGVRYDLPALPPAAPLDVQLLQDRHIAAQQRASLLWSLLSAAEAELGSGRMINAWSCSNALASAAHALRAMQQAGLPVPPLLLTNSLRALRTSATHGSQPEVLWSFPDEGVPLRSLSRKRWPELFRGHELPLLLLPPRTGDTLRAWVLHGRVQLVARVEAPQYAVQMRGLERFTYLAPDPQLQAIARRVYELFGLEIFELLLGESREGVRVEGLRPDPELMGLPPGARDFLLGALGARMGELLHADVAAPAPPAAEETRDAVFLTRLLEAPMGLAGA
jgi:hypothetical protein